MQLDFISALLIKTWLWKQLGDSEGKTYIDGLVQDCSNSCGPFN